jgi:arylsulfatase A-like enzyme
VSADIDGSFKEKDARVLGKLLEQIGDAGKSGKPFVYAFLPQISHGPWLAPEASKEALFREGRERLGQLDASLAAIVDALKRNGLYENTVIVVTADHGLRTRKEAAFLKTTVLNEVSYHVPMLIHDPRMKQRVEITDLTSHLDISPTLHCLYGVRAAQIDTQGRAMTPVPSRPRMLYFGGAWYNGSDGLWDGHAFYSYNHQLNMLWKSGRFEFDESFPMRDERVVGQVAGLMQRQGSLQEALLGK